MSACLYHSGAKVNLYLRVGLPRGDGFHPVLTLLATVDLEEALHFEFGGEGIHLEVRGADLGDPEQNLVTRALRLAAGRWGLGNSGVRVLLEKRLPFQAGMGAGSANAAAALDAFARYHRPHTKREELLAMGAELGADVPFFLLGGYALGRGRGSELEVVSSRLKLPLLLIKPTKGMATAEAYRELDASRQVENAALGPEDEKALGRLIEALRSPGPHSQDLAKLLVNDFHPPLVRTRPWLQEVGQALLDVGALRALLSGSGSTILGLFDSVEARDHGASRLEERQDWMVFRATTGGPGIRRQVTNERSFGA
jgi:4-diphosphocytidyl-2-C-methyl-D-erythritol kinase